MSYEGNIIYEKYVIHALLTNMPRTLKIAGIWIPRSLIVGCSVDESITGSYLSVFKRKLNLIYFGKASRCSLCVFVLSSVWHRSDKMIYN